MPSHAQASKPSIQQQTHRRHTSLPMQGPREGEGHCGHAFWCEDHPHAGDSHPLGLLAANSARELVHESSR